MICETCRFANCPECNRGVKNCRALGCPYIIMDTGEYDRLFDLLREAMDAIPDYIDGRNDDLAERTRQAILRKGE